MAPRSEFQSGNRPIAHSFTANADTMEDRFAVSTPPVRDAGLDACFTAIQEAENLELLTVDPENRMVHIRRTNALDGPRAQSGDNLMDSAAPKSDSGWQQITVEVPDTRIKDERWPRGDIDEIRGFRQNGLSYSLVHFPEKLTGDQNQPKRRYIEPMIFDPDNGWRKWTIEGEAGLSLLGSVQTEVFVDDRGRTVIYGKPTGYSHEDETVALVFEDDSSGDWQTVLGVFPLQPGIDYTYRLTANTDPDSLGTLFRLGNGSVVEFQRIGITPPDPRFPEPRLRYSPTDWQHRDLSESIADIGELGAARFLDLPDQPGTFVVHSASTEKLYLVTGLEGECPEIDCLTDETGFCQTADLVRVARDDSHTTGNPAGPNVGAAILMIDSSDERNLWIKRQQATSENGRPVFSGWAPLGSQSRTVALPRTMSNGTELFTVNEQIHRTGYFTNNIVGGIAIERRSFDHTGQAWHTEQIETTRESVDDVEACITHTCELNLTTGDGTPAANALAYLSAASPCVAVVNGVSRHLSPTQPVRAFSNAAGMIVVKIKADSIDTPALSLRLADSDSQARQVLPNGAVARRLAGRQEDHRIDHDRLCKAGLIPEDLDRETGKRLAEMVRKAGQAIGQANQDQEGSMEGSCWYHGSFGTPDAVGERPTLTIRSGKGAVPESLQIMDSTSTPSGEWSAGRAADGLGLAGDIISWIKDGIDTLVTWSIEFGRRVAKFAIRLANGVWEFVVDTAQGLARAMEALFQAIARTLGEVIDAAKTLLNVVAALFEIDAIRRTNTCLAYTINGGLLVTEQLIGEGLSRLTHDVADKVLKHVDDQLSVIEDMTRKLTLGGVSTSGFPDRDDGSSSFGGRNALMQTGGVQARWVGERVMTHIDRFERVAQSNLVDSETAGKITDRVLALAEEFHSDDPDRDTVSKLLFDVAHDMQRDFKEGVQGVDLFRIFSYVRRVVNLTGHVFVKVLDIIYELIADAIGLLRKFLNMEIDIPGVNQLADLVFGRRLRVIDLFTFMFAVGLTVFWKIISKGKELFDEETTRRLLGSGLLPDPEDGATGRDDDELVHVFVIDYLRVEMAKLFGLQPDPDDVQALTRFAENNREVTRVLSPVATGFNLIRYFALGTVGVFFAAATDIADTASYGAGSASVGYVGSVFTVLAVGSAAAGIIMAMVKNLTIEYIPDSPEGQLWKKQRDLVPPGDWPSLAWVLSVTFGIVGFICCSPSVKIPQPFGAMANSLLNVYLGIYLIIGTIVYTGFLIALNKPRGWRIANQFGTMLGSVPSFFRWVPAINSELLKLTPWGSLAAVLLSAVLLLTNGACTVASCVTAIGDTIDENMAQSWSDFSTS